MEAGSVGLGMLGRGRVGAADCRFGRSMWYLGRWGGVLQAMEQQVVQSSLLILPRYWPF